LSSAERNRDTAKQAYEKWDELRKKVQDAESDLPENAKKPQVNDDLSKTFIQTLNITANSLEDL
jgi:multidrug efflux pump subunit AcrB